MKTGMYFKIMKHMYGKIIIDFTNIYFRDTTSVINDLCETLTDKNDGKICCYMDEVIIENPRSSSPEDLLGKVPFLLDGDVFPWSELDSHGVNLIVCVNPESKDLALLHNIDQETVLLLKHKKPEPLFCSSSAASCTSPLKGNLEI